MPLVPHTPAAEAQDHAALVAALDAGDLAGPHLARAETLLAGCAGCAALRDDLVVIRAAVSALPAPVRRRDYRLTEKDATRLRPAGWRRLAGWLAAPRSSVQPLATGLAALGVVGLLLTAGLPGFGAGVAVLSPGGAAPESTADVLRSTTKATEEPPLAPGEAPVPGLAGEPSPAPSDGAVTAPGDVTTGGEVPESAAGGEDVAGDPAAARPEPQPGPSAPLVLSIVLLATGLGLLLARAIALRRA